MKSSPPTKQSSARLHLQERYDRLWSDTIGNLRAGRIDIDPVLSAGAPDHRRGLTVIARPSLNVRLRVASFLDELRALEPDQYYYAPSEFHLTVLGLFTATVEPGPFLDLTKQYEAAVGLALRKVAPITISFAGITASPAAILVQGFCEDDALNAVREILRKQLRSHGLGKEVDGRYRLETAHMTVVRFKAPLRNSKPLASTLEAARTLPFGQSEIRHVSLVKNDWYMSAPSVETIARFNLR